MPNRLQYEKSPYLLQHAENPVDWRPWGADAFEEARRADKPVLLSIGYSTCHWCHVMAHESFEDETVAEAINRELEKALVYAEGCNRFGIGVRTVRDIFQEVQRLESSCV